MIDLSAQQTDDALDSLVAADESPIARVPRQPGQRESRWRHRVGLAERIDPSSVPPMIDADSDEFPVLPSSSATVAELEELRKRVGELELRVKALEGKRH